MFVTLLAYGNQPETEQGTWVVGFLPMQFSVRTERGEAVYKRIRVNAPLWSLEIERVRRTLARRREG